MQTIEILECDDCCNLQENYKITKDTLENYYKDVFNGIGRIGWYWKTLLSTTKSRRRLTKLKGAKTFSTLDAKSGYWQIELESQNLTCFNTPFSRYRFLRFPFDIKSASEEFQMRLIEALDGIEGI